jgi:hypothetical protein
MRLEKDSPTPWRAGASFRSACLLTGAEIACFGGLAGGTSDPYMARPGSASSARLGVAAGNGRKEASLWGLFFLWPLAVPVTRHRGCSNCAHPLVLIHLRQHLTCNHRPRRHPGTIVPRLVEVVFAIWPVSTRSLCRGTQHQWETKMKATFSALALAAVVALTTQASFAGSHHTKQKAAPQTKMNERLRSAHAYVLPNENWTSGAFRYDEAFSPPAGH